MDDFIFSKNDIRQATKEALKETLNLGDTFQDALIDLIVENLESNANLYRFYSRNCCGCVSDNEECDFAYGRNASRGKSGSGVDDSAYFKALRGEIFNCPSRVNGTMIFNQSEGLRSIDISDQDKPPYPIIDLGGE